MSKTKVLLAMSGGIDSSVAAILLMEQGYDVTGITFRSWDYISEGCMEKQTGCCSVDTIFEAKKLAEKLGFPHHILDIRKEFNDFVIQDFINEYLVGRTPNPCVVCNTHIKWGEILRKADELDCQYIATGHYARIKQTNNRFVLVKGVDQAKDQSYFLWTLTSENLSRTLFPLGNYVKDEVREIARQKGFTKLAEKHESQEICFIPDNDYRKFLIGQVPEIDKKYANGNFVSTSGKILGKHKGFPFYTIGQRKGLEIALGQPQYVVHINPKTNTIVLGNKEDLLKSELWVKNINITKYAELPQNIEVTTKIRYRNEGYISRITQDGDKLKLEFYEPVSAITPGQSAVFYEDDELIGGGIIV